MWCWEPCLKCVDFCVHYSKFVPPGAVRIGIDNSSPNIEATAFLTNHHTSSDVVVIAMNRNDSPANYTVFDSTKNSHLNLQLPGHSIQTIVYSNT